MFAVKNFKINENGINEDYMLEKNINSKLREKLHKKDLN